jgi:hypothetical protein
MMAAVLKFILNRIRQVGVLCGNSIFEASVLRWNTGAQDHRECIKAVTILTPSFAAALCVSN